MGLIYKVIFIKLTLIAFCSNLKEFGITIFIIKFIDSTVNITFLSFESNELYFKFGYCFVIIVRI